MIRNALFASLIALGAHGAAQAAEPGPWLVNTAGGPEVVHGPRHANVVGGGHAAITGGGDNLTYHAAPEARTQAPGPVATLSGGGEDARLLHEPIAPATTRLAERPNVRR